MRRFKRTIEKNGGLTELSACGYYEKLTAERERKKEAAVKRHFKRLLGSDAVKEVLQILALPRFRLNGAATSNRWRRSRCRHRNTAFRASRQGRIHYAYCANPLEEAVPKRVFVLMQWVIQATRPVSQISTHSGE